MWHSNSIENSQKRQTEKVMPSKINGGETKYKANALVAHFNFVRPHPNPPNSLQVG
jgi:hypothetical protein